jgi:hypothetical protein
VGFFSWFLYEYYIVTLFFSLCIGYVLVPLNNVIIEPYVTIKTKKSIDLDDFTSIIASLRKALYTARSFMLVSSEALVSIRYASDLELLHKIMKKYNFYGYIGIRILYNNHVNACICIDKDKSWIKYKNHTISFFEQYSFNREEHNNYVMKDNCDTVFICSELLLTDINKRMIVNCNNPFVCLSSSWFDDRWYVSMYYHIINMILCIKARFNNTLIYVCFNGINCY